jgi:antitoxin (DNA-binding transcriptional repressor) of toxin-antitoxin stability system
MATDVTSKVLHQETGKLLDRVRRGESFRLIRRGKLDGYLVPPSTEIDPEWPEIMGEVWAAQKKAGAVQENPVLRERKARNHAAHLR